MGVKMTELIPPKNLSGRWQAVFHEIIFEADTPSGKLFDVILIASIVLSVIAVMLDSVGAIQDKYGYGLYLIKWFFTLLFTLEYILRLLCVGRPWLRSL
jgi:voltage-gated potassium channel